MKKVCLFLAAALFLTLSGMMKAGALDYKFNMSYIYFGNSAAYTSLVDAAQGSLGEVAPNYFTLDDGGSLTLTTAATKSFADEMHARGIRIVPYLTNDWDRQKGVNALSNRAALTDAIVNAVETFGLDGVNIDLENLTEGQRADYVDFTRLLREKLPEGKTVAVAVASNPGGAATGWQGSYDYAGLAQYCDYLMIMAYDEHWYGSEAGPVSGMSFVEKSVQYALGLVPGDKIVLGLPFYGRIWSDSGGYPQGYGISNSRIGQLISQYRGAVTVDSGSMSAKAVITIKSSDTKPTVGGKTLAAGTYAIWFDNEQTLKAKLNLVAEYGLKGSGTWSLGQEAAGTWEYYRLWVNGCTFADIQTSWAKDYILDAYLSDMVEGYTPDCFLPDAPLTRAQAAAMLVRLLGYPLVTDTDGSSFTDIKGSWAEDYINTAKEHGLVAGVGGSLFDPDRAVTRQEIAVMLNNFLDYSAPDGQASFSDVTPDGNAWSYGAILALSANGVVDGYADGSFRPLRDISRAEMTAMLTRIKAV